MAIYSPHKFKPFNLAMKLLRLNALAPNTQLPKTAVTIGNFDGVHLGHQAMITQLKEIAVQQNLKTAVKEAKNSIRKAPKMESDTQKIEDQAKEIAKPI